MKGHIAVACRNRTKAKGEKNDRQGRYVNRITPDGDTHSRREVHDDHSNEDGEIYYINRIDGKQPYTIQLLLNREAIKFEIDTGSGITIISETN